MSNQSQTDKSISFMPSLLAMSTATRHEAQRLMDFNQYFYWASIIFSCFGVFYNEKIAWTLVVIGFICKITSFFIYQRAQNLHAISREAQRLAVLENAYGRILETFWVVELRKKVGIKLEEKAKAVDYASPYYTSVELTGNNRLRENIQESTFWSRNILEKYSKMVLLRMIITISVTIGILILLLVINPDIKSFIKLNPYLLTLAAITLLLGIVDYANIYISSISAAKLLFEVDQRLDKIDTNNIDSLLSTFADYCIASVTAPPIPFKIYKTNQIYLRDLWRQRVDSLRKIRQQDEIAKKKKQGINIDFEKSIIPNWVNEDTFYNLLFDVSIELSKSANRDLPSSINVEKINSFSKVSVFDIQLLQESTIWRHLVLRLHPNPSEARIEFNIIERIKNESSDLVAYLPLKDPFIDKGALFYYHANIQTHDQLSHVQEYIWHYIYSKNTDFDNYFNKLFSSIETLSAIYEKIGGSYSSKTIQKVSNEIIAKLPPSYVLDLRSTPYKIENDTLVVSQNRIFPSPNESIISNPFNFDSNCWIKTSFKINETIDYQHHSSGVIISSGIDKCLIITDTLELFNKLTLQTKKIDILLHPLTTIEKLSDFINKEMGLDLSSYNFYKTVNDILNKIPKKGLYFGFRHNDLHCENCLISKSNFKVIDIAESEESLICSDIARLEISILSHLIRKTKLSDVKIKEVLSGLESEKYNSINDNSVSVIIRVILEIRKSFYKQFSIAPPIFDVSLAYYIELYQQVSYSLMSPNKLPSEFKEVIEYWHQKLLKSF